MIIEDLIDFDKNNLTDYKLVWSKMGKVFYSFYISSIFILLIAYCIPLFMVRQEDPKYGWLILCIPILIALFFLGRIGKKNCYKF